METEPKPQSEAQSLLDADQADRANPHISESDALTIRDQERLSSIKQLLDSQEITTPQDLYAAAMILHHAGTYEDIYQAHLLAEEAVRKGSKAAQWLSAATFDRYLMMKGEPYQKYGTQYKKNSRTGKFELYPVDPNVPDSDRIKLGLPPLADIKLELNE